MLKESFIIITILTYDITISAIRFTVLSIHGNFKLINRNYNLSSDVYLVIHSIYLNAHQFNAMLRLAVITDFIMIKITVIDQNKAASHV